MLPFHPVYSIYPSMKIDFSLYRSLVQSLYYDRRIHSAVILGVLCASAVLTGALLVGDSMRGSLRALTLDRLGRIDAVLQSPTFFPMTEDSFKLLPNDPWTEQVPAILVPAAAESDGRIAATQLLGLPEKSGLGRIELGRDEVLVNRALADRLKLEVGQPLSLRLDAPSNVAPESSFGRRDDRILRVRVTVREIIPNRGLGRFSMKANQQAEPIVLFPLDRLRNRLKREGKVNTVFFLTDRPERASTDTEFREAAHRFKPSAEQLDIVVQKKEDRFYLTSNRMLFTEAQAEELLSKNPGMVPGLLYLATSVKAVKNGRETPYSTVIGMDLPQDAARDGTSKTRDALDPIRLNRWTADDLDVEPGDEIELTWFLSDDVHKNASKRFRLAEILSMDGIGADDRLAPLVEGFTDEAAIADWNPPFPFDAKRIRKKDEDYWDRYRAAPKAIVPLEIGRKLWGGRFGTVTTFLRREAPSAGDLTPQLYGMNLLPVKAMGLAASAGTTPFSVLFLSFSFFIIASALMLVAMLFRLAVEMKAERIGIRLAVGWTPRRTGRLLALEGLLLAVAGSFLGTIFGILYAKVMIHGLTTWWVRAVTVPFLELHLTPQSLAIGFCGGVLMALSAVAWSMRRIVRLPIKTLLAGETEDSFSVYRTDRRGILRRFDLSWFYGIPGLVIAVVAAAATLPPGSVSLNFSIAALLLALSLVAIRDRYAFLARKSSFRSPLGFAETNAARHRGRSLLCIALVASTTFLILSIGIFRLDPEKETTGAMEPSGSGGFSFLGETAFPVFHDPASVRGREELGLQESEIKHLAASGFEILSIRMRDGDDAGCLNLYRSNSPRVLGVPKAILRHDLFRFAKKGTGDSPWERLRKPVGTDPDAMRRVPVILDANTAMYSLHLTGRIGEVYDLDDGRGGTIRCEVVGLLGNSVLQGDILMSEENLSALFPEAGGYRFFLARSERGPLDDASVKIMYDMLGDYGFQGAYASDRLRELFAVQNTYLSTFQSLGGIGLLLGLFGFAVLQARNVFERRKELALMRAIGFSSSRVILILLYESLSLLLKGLALACFASIFALLPFLAGTTTQSPGDPVPIVILFLKLLGTMFVLGVLSNLLASWSVLRIPIARELAEEY